MASLFKCIFGPKLYRIHRTQEIQQGKPYEPNIVEKHSNSIVRYISYLYSFSIYTSPVFAAVLYKKGYFGLEGFVSLVRVLGMIGVIWFSAMFFRGLGRYHNHDYLTFLMALDSAKKHSKDKYMIFYYDFDFSAWPVDFMWSEGEGDDSKPRIYIDSASKKSRGSLEKVKGLPCQLASYIAAHTFGHRLVYPGAVGLLQAVLNTTLLQGRTKLVEENNGIRAKLLTQDHNEIDTMFIDRRNQKNFHNGNTLVICCEGNAGFYEIGIMVTPLDAGYSTLGWNHPGFGGSTGIPFPDQETKAIDCVMQYAIHRLGFYPENIMLFAWSIGGFAASWAAMNYPDVKAVILDATFDDLIPLATIRMPESWKNLVILTVKTYMNLNIAAQLTRYPGPVLLIRRTKDEMITTVDPTVIASNRGNILLLRLLQHRYPKLIDEKTIVVLQQWLSCECSQQTVMWVQYEPDEAVCSNIILSYIDKYGSSFPMNVGEELSEHQKTQMILFLAHRHLSDFDSTHCTPLPATFFHMPWVPESGDQKDSESLFE